MEGVLSMRKTDLVGSNRNSLRRRMCEAVYVRTLVISNDAPNPFWRRQWVYARIHDQLRNRINRRGL